jgi:hypothetical protein
MTDVPALPPGFMLDSAASAPPPPPSGFTLDQPIEDFFRSMPYGAASSLAGLASDVSKGAAAERIALGLADPSEIEQAPTQAESLAGVEQLTGPLHRPQTRAGKFGVAAAGAAANPLSYLGPGGLLTKFAGAVTGGLASELAGEATEGTPYETPARIAGGLAGGIIPGFGGRAAASPPRRPAMPEASAPREPAAAPTATVTAPTGPVATPREGSGSPAPATASPPEPLTIDPAKAEPSSGEPQTRSGESPESVLSSHSPGKGSPAAGNTFESASSPEPLSQQQIVENRAKIADFVTRVGIPIDRVGSIEIGAVARRMGSLPLPDAIERAALKNALEGGVVSPHEVDWIYGPGAADEIRGTSTPANGPAHPAQGRAPGQSAAHVAEGQSVPRPGEGGGETGTRPPVRSGDASAPIAENGEYQPRDASSRPEEPAGPAQAVRPAGIGSSSDPLSRPFEETGARNTGPPSDQLRFSENGAPSGAVSVSGVHEAQTVGGPVAAPRGPVPAEAVATPALAKANDREIVSPTETAPQPPLVSGQLPAHRLWYQPRRTGQAPIGDDGFPVELHHVGQEHGGGLIEMTRTEHRGRGNFGANHDNTGQRPSLIDRWRAARERRKYWAEQSERFKDLPTLSEAEWKQLRPWKGRWSRPAAPDYKRTEAGDPTLASKSLDGE